MSPRLFLLPASAACKTLIPLAQGCAARFKGLASVSEVPIMHMPATAVPPSATSPVTVHGITTEHAAIFVMLEDTARLGHVPADALIGRLHRCHVDLLAQDRQQLAVLEQELEGHLARLDARFPVLEPAPVKPEPVRGRRFGAISSDLRANAPSTKTPQ